MAEAMKLADPPPAAKTMNADEAHTLVMVLVGQAMSMDLIQLRPRPRLKGEWASWLAFAFKARDALKGYNATWDDFEVLVAQAKIVYQQLTGRELPE